VAAARTRSIRLRHLLRLLLLLLLLLQRPTHL